MERLLVLPYAVLLFILPFPGTVALRLVCLAAAFVITALMWRRWAPPKLPDKGPIVVWIIVTAAAVSYSFDVSYSLGEFKNETLYVLMAFVAFFGFSRSKLEVTVMLAALGAAIGVIAVWGGIGSLRLGMWDEGGGHGGSGTVSNLLAAVAPFFALALLETRGRRAQLLLVAALVLIVLTAVLTRQRILWPLFTLQFVLGIVLLRKANIRVASLRRLSALVAVAALIAVAAVAGLQNWRAQTRQVRPVESDARLYIWPKAAKIIIEHPWTGEGLGRQAMRKTHPELVPPEDPYLWHAHNVFLNAGISMGMPGVLALLLVFGAFTASYVRLLASHDRTARLIAIAGILMVVGVVGRNLTNDLFVRDGSLLFWALNGVLLGAGARYAAARGATA